MRESLIWRNFGLERPPFPAARTASISVVVRGEVPYDGDDAGLLEFATASLGNVVGQLRVASVTIDRDEGIVVLLPRTPR